MDNMDSPSVVSRCFLTPLLISMLGIVITSLAILAYHFILVKYCSRRSRQQQQQQINTQTTSLPTCFPLGVDQKVLETIPIIPYSTRVDQGECVVCLGELQDGEMVRLLPICKHAFHLPCIDKWFSAHINCPLCRCSINNVPTNADVLPPPTSDDVNNTNGVCSSGVESCSVLRHCISLALPMERRRSSSSRRLITGLKRSLSMDQSFVIVDLQRECSAAASPSRSGGVVDRAWSIRQFDRVSSKLLRSLSQLRRGKGCSGILPY